MSVPLPTMNDLQASHNAVVIDGPELYRVVGELCDHADRGYTPADYYSRCFESICRHFQASVGILNLRMGARTLERTFAAEEIQANTWVPRIDPLLLRAQTEVTPLAQSLKNRAGVKIAQLIAVPILSSRGHVVGGISLAIHDAICGPVESCLVALHQILELIVENAPTKAASVDSQRSDESASRQSVVRASDYRSIHHLGFSIANSLCNKMSCEQIAIGLIRRHEVRLIAVSGLSQIPGSTPGMTAVRQAMAACYDRNESTVVQEEGHLLDQSDSSTCQLHYAWHRQTGGSSVATIPLQIDGRCVAVVALRRPANRPFLQEEMKRAKLLAESFAPALPLVDRASRSVIRHVAESSMESLAKWYGWNGWGRKATAACCLLFFAWIVLGRVNYHVLAPCKIVPERINTVSAPFDGIISNVFISPGDHVVEGDLLVQFETRDLLIERSRILASIASTRIEANARLQERKADEAFLLQAKVKVLETELQLIDQKIEGATLRAVDDGIVMPTDIDRRVGQYVSLGEPLLEVADTSQWHVEIETAEKDARHLDLGQDGRFQTNARPDHQVPCRITDISPSSEIVRQRNVVLAEAVLDEPADWMKIGMEGHIRVTTVPQPVWWVYLHPIFDFVRLKLWM